MSQGYVANWVQERPFAEKELQRRELFTDPYTSERAEGVLVIVVDGRPGSRLWKDYLVLLARGVPRIPGITFEGFWDLNTNTPHPASLRRTKRGDNWPTDPR
jgi:hypothetical protein